MCYFFCYSSPNWDESLFVPLTNHRIKISSPHSRRPSLPAPPPHGQAHLCLSVSVTHMSLHPACQSPTKFPGSQYIWQYFISDLRISERISVQAGSLAWKFRSVWKARRLHDVGALQYPPVLLYPLSLFPLLSVVDLAVSGCLTQHWVTPQGAKYS